VPPGTGALVATAVGAGADAVPDVDEDPHAASAVIAQQASSTSAPCPAAGRVIRWSRSLIDRSHLSRSPEAIAEGGQLWRKTTSEAKVRRDEWRLNCIYRKRLARVGAAFLRLRGIVGRRNVAAVSLAGVYLVACGWALWNRLDAVLLFAVVSPVAAGFMFPEGANTLGRVLIGAFIDACLAALAFVPVLGDFIDLAASLVALVLLIIRFRQFASSLPGGAACVLLYLFLWFEAGILPGRFSVSSVHHAVWFYPAMVFAVTVVGGVILGALTMLLGLMYGGDRARAIFSTVGFPWYTIMFFLTIFLPNRHVKHVHQSVAITRRGA
jgi:hypothetical protein